jgi:hypothetical protein
MVESKKRDRDQTHRHRGTYASILPRQDGLPSSNFVS